MPEIASLIIRMFLKLSTQILGNNAYWPVRQVYMKLIFLLGHFVLTPNCFKIDIISSNSVDLNRSNAPQ